jgi:hypothetical protein
MTRPMKSIYAVLAVTPVVALVATLGGVVSGQRGGGPQPPFQSGGAIILHGAQLGSFSPPEPACVPATRGPSEACAYRTPRDGTIRNLRILVAFNTYTGPATLVLYVNEVPALFTIIPGGSTTDIDVVGEVAVVDGDRISVGLDRTGVAAGQIALNLSYELK